MTNKVTLTLEDYNYLQERIDNLEDENKRLMQSFAIKHTGFFKIRAYLTKGEVEKELAEHNRRLEDANHKLSSVINNTFLKTKRSKRKYSWIKDFVL